MTEIREEYIEAAKELLKKRKAIQDKRQAEVHARYNEKRIAAGLPPVEEREKDHRDRFYEKKRAEQLSSPEYIAAAKAREEKSYNFMLRLAKDLQDRGDRVSARKAQAVINAKARAKRKYEAKKAKQPKKIKVPKPPKEKKIRIPKVKIPKEPKIKLPKPPKPIKVKIVRDFAPKKLIRVPRVYLEKPPKRFRVTLPKAPEPLPKPKPIPVPKVAKIKIPKPPKVKKLKRDDIKVVKNILMDQNIKIRQIDLTNTIKVMLDSKTEVRVKPGTDIEALKKKFAERNEFKPRR